jgi:hypothetical protein
MPRRFNVEQQEPGEQFAEDFYAYIANIGTILTLATGTDVISIEADSDFELVKLCASGNKNGAAEPWAAEQIIPMNLQVSDGGSGRQLFSEAIPLNSIAGRATLPMVLPVYRRWNARSTINVSLTSYSASTWDNLTVTFIGKKIFKVRADT